MLNALLHEIHRLRKLIRDAKAEIDKAPKLLKAHQTKLANLQKAASDAKDELKKRKAHQMELESRLKAAGQTLAKHEKQFNELSSPKEFAAKQADIDSTKTVIAQLETEILEAITDIEERTAKIPTLDAAAAKGVTDFATFEKEAAEKLARLKVEAADATKKLAEKDAQIPPAFKVQYERLVKAHGADGLAPVENNSCSACRINLTQQQMGDIQKERISSCQNCGKVLYRP
ncbi:zinc ribbon domain-containing protein [Zavarzinella formosa]|uniref:zinc ribbon domain-containing protein n=1 Tax=Zavarzinella formosa TaxID=360055 RepID=UPI0002F9A195|nr:hypothetical protein [Zavarzinella formosa]